MSLTRSCRRMELRRCRHFGYPAVQVGRGTRVALRERTEVFMRPSIFLAVLWVASCGGVDQVDGESEVAKSELLSGATVTPHAGGWFCDPSPTIVLRYYYMNGQGHGYGFLCQWGCVPGTSQQPAHCAFGSGGLLTPSGSDSQLGFSPPGYGG